MRAGSGADPTLPTYTTEVRLADAVSSTLRMNWAAVELPLPDPAEFLRYLKHKAGLPDGIPAGQEWQVFDRQQVVVEDVIDGDTIDVRLTGTSGADDTRVRLLGIDTPEKGAHWGEEATRFTAGQVEGSTVTLRLGESETRDRYGRLLAYVYLDDARTLNELLVREGHAYAHRRYPHQFQPQFEAAENEARRDRRGLWRDVTVEQMPDWRQAWLKETGREGR